MAVSLCKDLTNLKKGTFTNAIRYHTDPFYMEVNSTPEHANVTATFIDNYSQISIDFGKTNSGFIKLGTRFGAMDVYIISADSVPRVVRFVKGLPLI